MKSVRIRSYSGPYFPAFGMNTERSSVYLSFYTVTMLPSQILVYLKFMLPVHFDMTYYQLEHSYIIYLGICFDFQNLLTVDVNWLYIIL